MRNIRPNKRNLSSLVFALLIMIGTAFSVFQSSAQTLPVCRPTMYYQYGYCYLSNVTIGSPATINNNTSYVYSGSGYTYYNLVGPGIMAKGTSVAYSFTSSCIWGQTDFNAYIDWNHDGSFNNSDEWVVVGGAYSNYSASRSGNITVPLTALSGKAIMRVISEPYFYGNCAGNACGTNYYGETEDYIVMVGTGNDAGITAVTSPSATPNADNYDVTVTLKNFGNNGLTSCTINWSMGGITQTPYSWSGTAITKGSTANITIATNQDFSYNGGAGPYTNYPLRVWTSGPNGTGITPDDDPSNDSYSTTIIPTMYDAGISIMAGPVMPLQPGVKPVVVRVYNNSQVNNLTSVKIEWSIDGAQPLNFGSSTSATYTTTPGQINIPAYNGVPPQPYADIQVGSFNFGYKPGFVPYVIQARVFSPNGGTDRNSANDMLTPVYGVAPALTPGVYNVGGADGVFSSLSQATSYIHNYGLFGTGKVEFNVRAGTYSGNMLITALTLDAGSSLVIKADAGVTVTLNSSTTVAFPFAFDLANLHNVTIDNVILNVTGFGGFGGAFRFNTVDNLILKNCTVNGVTRALGAIPSSTNYDMININNSNNVLIDNNIVRNGSRSLYETSAGTIRNLTVTNNLFSAFSGQGFYSSRLGQCTPNILIIDNNSFSADATVAPNSGVYIDNGSTITNNIFSGFLGTVGTDAIIAVNHTTPIIEQSLITGNRMSNSDNINGILATTVANLDIENNTITLTSTTGNGVLANGIQLNGCGSVAIPAIVKRNTVSVVDDEALEVTGASYINASYNNFSNGPAIATQYAVNLNATQGYFVNNMVAGHNSTALYLNATNMSVYYNAIANFSNSAPALVILNGTNILRRNLVQNNGTGLAINLTGNANAFDENNYYSAGQKQAPALPIGSWNLNTDFTSWKLSSNQDGSSTTQEASFVDFHLLSGNNLHLAVLNEAFVFETPLFALNSPLWTAIEATDFDNETRFSYFMGPDVITPVITILQEPVGIMDCLGAKGRFIGVTAAITLGVAPKFEWYKDGVKLSSLYEKPGEMWAQRPILYLDSSTYAFNVGLAYAMEGSYYAEIKGSGAQPMATKYTLVSVLRPGEITRQPESRRVDLGGNVAIEIESNAYIGQGSSTPPYTQPDVQWYRMNLTNPLVDEEGIGGRIAGTKSTILTIRNIKVADYGNDYFCVIKGKCATLTSDMFTIAPYPGITWDSLATPANACEGTDITLTMVATTDDLNAQLSYQWQFKGANIAGENESVLTLANLAKSNEGNYKCIITVQPGNKSDTSNAVTITVIALPTFTKEQSDTTATAGKPLVLACIADGNNLEYQWYKDDVEISGATSSTFSISSATFTDEGVYTVKIKNTCGEKISRDAHVNITVLDMVGVKGAVTGGFVLFENIPNPMTEESTINFYAPYSTQVRLTLTDAYGKDVAVLFNKTAPAGMNQVKMTTSELGLSSGMYYYTLSANGFTTTHKMVVVK